MEKHIRSLPPNGNVGRCTLSDRVRGCSNVLALFIFGEALFAIGLDSLLAISS